MHSWLGWLRLSCLWNKQGVALWLFLNFWSIRGKESACLYMWVISSFAHFIFICIFNFKKKKSTSALPHFITRFSFYILYPHKVPSLSPKLFSQPQQQWTWLCGSISSGSSCWGTRPWANPPCWSATLRTCSWGLSMKRWVWISMFTSWRWSRGSVSSCSSGTQLGRRDSGEHHLTSAVMYRITSLHEQTLHFLDYWHRMF